MKNLSKEDKNQIERVIVAFDVFFNSLNQILKNKENIANKVIDDINTQKINIIRKKINQ